MKDGLMFPINYKCPMLITFKNCFCVWTLLLLTFVYYPPGSDVWPAEGFLGNFVLQFDDCLSLDAHISNICRSTHFYLRDIGRIGIFCIPLTGSTFRVTAQLIHVLITTRLDFCNSILYNPPNIKIERLQRIQNQAARMLTRSPRRNHMFREL